MIGLASFFGGNFLSGVSEVEISEYEILGKEDNSRGVLSICVQNLVRIYNTPNILSYTNGSLYLTSLQEQRNKYEKLLA